MLVCAHSVGVLASQTPDQGCGGSGSYKQPIRLDSTFSDKPTSKRLLPMGGLANGTPSNAENFRPSCEVLKWPLILPNEVVTKGL
jgi:hypothetical protein